MQNQEGEVYIDATLIPDFMWDKLADMALDLLAEIEAKPGGAEALEAEKVRIRDARVGA